MLLKINPKTPNESKLKHVTEALENDGIIIFPTDTVYAFGCHLHSKKAVKRICEIKGVKLKKAKFSIICPDLSNLSEYATDIDKPLFKILNKNLPGPFTFILNASSKIPKIFENNKKEIGIRVPDNAIARKITEEIGAPLITTSLHHENEILDYETDPEAIFEKYKKLVDIVIDGGPGDNIPSTVVDCTNEEAKIMREGKGELAL